MESEKMVEFGGFFDNFSTQVIIVLSMVGIVLMIGGLISQGFGRAVFGVAGVFVLIALILVLKDGQAVGQWIKDKVFKLNMITPTQLKGYISYGIQLYKGI